MPVLKRLIVKVVEDGRVYTPHIYAAHGRYRLGPILMGSKGELREILGDPDLQNKIGLKPDKR